MNLFAHNGILHNTFIEALMHIITSGGFVLFTSLILVALLMLAARGNTSKSNEKDL